MLTPPTQKQQNEIVKLTKKYATLKENAWKDATDGKITLEAFNIANDSLNAELSYTIKEKNDNFDIQNIKKLCSDGIKEPSFLSYMDKNDLTKDTDENILYYHYVMNFCLNEWVSASIKTRLDNFLIESERRKSLGLPVEVKEALFQKYRGGIYKALDTRMYEAIKDEYKPLFELFSGYKTEIEESIKAAINNKRNSEYIYMQHLGFRDFKKSEMPTEIMNLSQAKHLFNLGIIDGQFSFYPGHEHLVYFSLYAEKDTPEELRRLSPYDRRVYNAISTLYDKTNNYQETEHSKYKLISVDNLFYLVSGGKGLDTAADNQITALLQAIERMAITRVDINNQKEVEYREKHNKKKKPFFKVEHTYLLEASLVFDVVKGKPTFLIAIKDEPVLLTFMKSRKEIANIPVKVFNTKNQLTDTNILIEDYLLEYIYRYTNTSFPQISTFIKDNKITKNKQRIVKTFEKTLNYYKDIGIVKEWEIKNGEIQKLILGNNKKILSIKDE